MTDLEKTYRDEGPRLLNWIRRRLGVNEDPEDLLQDIFTRAADALTAAAPVDNLVSWLYVSARNAVVDTWREREKTPVSRDAGVLELSAENLINESVVPGPEEAFRRIEAMEALEDALDDLPDGQREVFLLQAVDGYTFRETAELLDISINTAMSRKRYAVARLRERLGDYKNAAMRQEER
jgi:RNA polymerase sigma factor (sigma-70 family)